MVFSSSEYLFAGDAIASMEKYRRDLANSVMSRAEEVYRDFNTSVLPSLSLSLQIGLPSWFSLQKFGLV